MKEREILLGELYSLTSSESVIYVLLTLFIVYCLGATGFKHVSTSHTLMPLNSRIILSQEVGGKQTIQQEQSFVSSTTVRGSKEV